MRNQKQSKRRFSSSDWLNHGLKQLADVGPSGVTIDALCQSTGKTKGSFYSHFSSMADFTAQLAQQWQKKHTHNVIAAAKQVDDTQQRRQLLDAVAVGLDHQLEKNIRQFAANDPQVAAVVAQVDRERVEFLGRCYVDTGKFGKEDALALARVEYGFFLLYQSGIGWDEEVFADSYQRFLKIVGVG